jgi:hypothetical protein
MGARVLGGFMGLLATRASEDTINALNDNLF